MFPSTHDITPSVEEPCTQLLMNLLKSGNHVLVVSKPHLNVITRLCNEASAYKQQVLFRFTIGAMSDDVLHYWEPGAPPFAERLASLKYAFEAGFGTSVSVEPMLDSAHVAELYTTLERYVTDSIWIGKMNHTDTRVEVHTAEDQRRLQAILTGQTDECILRIYRTLKDCPKIKWKESVKKVVGLPLADTVGQDT
eukprot:TRINITY_DN1773_c0_g1_i1.p1 TRINITY_DN1773_c0_g1~~TRINITY_DN1773_c0_g1_i1.p1  ORF type:complete len:195 (-),score=38.99 TRINITY_DN1773_c0_g1_i1:45-629(-)